jgi:hypothetical protein
VYVPVPVFTRELTPPELSVVEKSCLGGDCARVIVCVVPLVDVEVYTAWKVAFFAFWIEPPNDCSCPAPPPVAEVVPDPAPDVVDVVDDEDEPPHPAASRPTATSGTTSSH